MDLPPRSSSIITTGGHVTPDGLIDCVDYRALYAPIEAPGTRAEADWPPLRNAASTWRRCRSWTLLVSAAPGPEGNPIEARAGAMRAARLAGLDLAASGIPAAQVEEMTTRGDGAAPAQVSGMLGKRARALTPIEWPGAPDAASPAPKLPREVARDWADAVGGGGLVARVRHWNFAGVADVDRLALDGGVVDAFAARDVGEELALQIAGRDESPPAPGPALPLIEVRYDLAALPMEMLSWRRDAPRLSDGAKERLVDFARTAELAYQAKQLTGDWRILIEAMSLRGDNEPARMTDGLLAASEAQYALEEVGVPDDRIATLSCGSVRRAIMPDGADRSIAVSIVPDGIATPDKACGWDRAETFALPAAPPAPPIAEPRIAPGAGANPFATLPAAPLNGPPPSAVQPSPAPSARGAIPGAAPPALPGATPAQ